MEQFNEQQEQQKDQKYVDGFNIGYDLQKQLESESLPDKDRSTLESLVKVLKKSRSENDKIQGMIDGRKERLKERELQRLKEKRKAQSKERER
jgi:uncharacterized membrane protein